MVRYFAPRGPQLPGVGFSSPGHYIYFDICRFLFVYINSVISFSFFFFFLFDSIRRRVLILFGFSSSHARLLRLNLFLSSFNPDLIFISYFHLLVGPFSRVYAIQSQIGTET